MVIAGRCFTFLTLINSIARMNLFRTTRTSAHSMRLRCELCLYILSSAFLLNQGNVKVAKNEIIFYTFCIACKSSHGVEAPHSAKSYKGCGEVLAPKD